MRTGQLASRTTFSATERKASCLQPVNPCAAITIKSAFSSNDRDHFASANSHGGASPGIMTGLADKLPACPWRVGSQSVADRGTSGADREERYRDETS